MYHFLHRSFENDKNKLNKNQVTIAAKFFYLTNYKEINKFMKDYLLDVIYIKDDLES
jgi:hypothetical protein